MMTSRSPTAAVGRSVPRLEAHAKVTGRAEYVHNLVVPSMLYAKVFRSTLAHGRIRTIDTKAARAMPGVFAVYTGADIRTLIAEPFYGPAFHDQPILAMDKVRYVGEPVAVVLASDVHVAENAAALINAEYDELPAVYDEVEAMTSKAVVHDVLKPAGTFADLKYLKDKRDTNIALDFHLRRGDVAKAFAAADHVFEHTFRTQQVLHVPLEGFATVAEPSGDEKSGALLLHSSTQSPSFVRTEIARLFGWPDNKVRVKVPYLGGGFGAKVYVKSEALAAACAMLSKRPVKYALTMEEQFTMITKHATTARIKSGVTKEGKITARECEVWWNGGAYADIGPRVTQKSGFTAPGPYDIDNVHIDSYALYTHLPPAGALRGFGIPQLVWAYESHTDMIARELKIDPLEIRRKNLLREGRPQATGTPMRDAALDLVLERLATRMQWEQPFDKGPGTIKRGRGLAIGFKASISPTTSMAIVNLAADGSCSLYSSTVDMGQGSDTAMAQMVSEVMGVPLEKITVVHPDTDVTPYDMATLGSRSTFHMGHAVKNAAEDARDKLIALAREVGLAAETTPIPDIFRKKYGMLAGNIVGVGSFIPPYTPPDANGQTENATPFWMIGATGAEVEVDTETGEFKVTRLVNLVDVGKSINPAIVETQISGATVMQLGFTLSEKMNFSAGQCVNASFADYKIPGIRDIPPMENEAVDGNQRNGPFGAKGVGESGTFGVSPAIANAIDDAVGVRLTSLPLTAEAVYRGLREKAGKPLAAD
jgi:CO/xanthine dehydrogenase Mo-binding subunit